MEDTVFVPNDPGTASDNDDVTVDNAAEGTVLLEANPNRVSALIINTGGAAMRVTTDGTPPSVTRGKLIDAGGSLSLTSPKCPSEKILGFCETTTTANASEVI